MVGNWGVRWIFGISGFSFTFVLLRRYIVGGAFGKIRPVLIL